VSVVPSDTVNSLTSVPASSRPLAYVSSWLTPQTLYVTSTSVLIFATVTDIPSVVWSLNVTDACPRAAATSAVVATERPVTLAPTARIRSRRRTPDAAFSEDPTPSRVSFIKIQAGNPAVYGGEERDTERINRRAMADRLPIPNVIYMNAGCYV
jgi:hypothetical protein